MRVLTRGVLLLALATVTGVAPAASQTLPRGMQKVTSVEGITEYSMPNGLRILLFPDQTKPKVTVNITYLVGSRNEGYGESGMAHLLEHLLFLQTTTRPDIKKDITAHGSEWNGTTSWDRTNYFNTVAASEENIKWAIDLEADRMVNSKMEKAILDPEMTVVRNEFESGENSPQRMLFQRVLEAAYTFHNYGKMTIGSRSDIENVPIDKLAAFYKKNYQPDNAVVTVAGKFDESTVLAYVDAAFGKIPKPARTLDRTYTVEPTQDGERDVTLRRTGDVQAIVAVYHIPAASSADLPALEVLAEVLGAAPTGRLYTALVDSKKAVRAGMGAESMHDPGFMAATVMMRPDQSMDDARGTLLKTVEGIVAAPPTKEEVERGKARILKQVELNLANSELIGLILSESMASGDWRLFFWDRDMVAKVTEADVLRVAKAYLKPSNRTVGVFLPTAAPDRAEIAAAPDPAVMLKDYKGGKAASAGEAFDTNPAAIEKRITRAKLQTGLKTVLLPRQTRGGTVVASLTLRYGDLTALAGKGTIATFTGQMPIRGSTTHNRQQIQDELDRLKARLTISGNATNVVGSIETTEANLPATLKLLAELLKQPAFPESEFETVKQQRLSALEAGRHEPQAVASTELQQRFGTFPKDDFRYVGSIDEQIEDVKKVTLADVRVFHAKFYGASYGELIVSGQFDKAQVEALAQDLFGSWKSPSTFTRVLTNYQQIPARDKLFETPDKANAAIFAGAAIKLNDEDPDYPALIIGNYLFGGSGASRLFRRIRDKEGLSYGVNSGLQAIAGGDRGIFQMFAICAPQNAPKAEASLRDELAKTVAGGFTEEEVAAAKKSYLQERGLNRSQDQFLASTLGQREYFDRTMKFDETLEAKIGALTAAQVSAAFKKHIDPAAISYIKAGDFKKAGVYQQQ
jgi:zinc protease